MNKREPDLDRITTLLGQCLGRIDEQAFRLQRMADEDEDFLAVDVLENEAATLQELVGTLMETVAVPDDADLNSVVEQTVQACLAEVDMPVVVRQRLAAALPRIACAPGQLAFAVQRSLMIGLGRLEPGDEILLATRRTEDGVVFEMESRGSGRDRHLQERTATLLEFVAGFQGRCSIEADDQGTLLLALELPTALAPDEL